MDLDLGDTRLIIAEAKKRGVLRNQLAYLLGTARWETGHTMKPVREAYWLSETWRRKNLRYYPHYGRGYVQLTWDYNYAKAGKRLGFDPSDLDAALQPKYAVPILIIGCMEGWFTGKKIPDYITLHKSDYVGARRVVNGTDEARKIAELAEQYEAALIRVGYGVDDTPPPPDVEHIAHPDPAEQPQGWLAAIVALLMKVLGK